LILLFIFSFLSSLSLQPPSLPSPLLLSLRHPLLFLSSSLLRPTTPSPPFSLFRRGRQPLASIGSTPLFLSLSVFFSPLFPFETLAENQQAAAEANSGQQQIRSATALTSGARRAATRGQSSSSQTIAAPLPQASSVPADPFSARTREQQRQSHETPAARSCIFRTRRISTDPPRFELEVQNNEELPRKDSIKQTF
ncbi:hypothetical protein AABB24_038402, partial [Solanum stoloniferum]